MIVMQHHGNDFIEDHGDAAESDADELSRSPWVTLCQCEEWKWQPEGLGGKT